MLSIGFGVVEWSNDIGNNSYYIDEAMHELFRKSSVPPLSCRKIEKLAMGRALKIQARAMLGL